MWDIQNLWYQLTRMQWSDYLDIAIVAFLIFRFLPLIRSSGAIRVAVAVGALFVASWLTELLNLHALNFVLDQVLSVGLIAVVIIFQPELRRMLDHLGRMRLTGFLGVEKKNQEMEHIIHQTVRACEVMSKERIGALMVFARDNRLDEYTKTGTEVDALPSEQLIRNIFFPKAALHDGAMIIRDGRVTAAGCVLPLSHSHRLSADLGTRHRAGVGMSEVSDAVVVIVSEETGIISVAVGGVLKRYLAPQMLEKLLRSELCPEEKQDNAQLFDKLRGKLKNKDKGGKKQ